MALRPLCLHPVKHLAYFTRCTVWQTGISLSLSLLEGRSKSGSNLVENITLNSYFSGPKIVSYMAWGLWMESLWCLVMWTLCHIWACTAYYIWKYFMNSDRRCSWSWYGSENKNVPAIGYLSLSTSKLFILWESIRPFEIVLKTKARADLIDLSGNKNVQLCQIQGTMGLVEIMSF